MTDPTPDWWIKAIADFGANLGFADSGTWRRNFLSLSMDGGRYLIDVERAGDDIIIAVLRDVPLPDVDEQARFLLRQCSFEHYRPHFLQAGMKGDNTLVLGARLHLSQSHQMYEALEQIRKVFAEAGL